jgi:hypothetical protein
MKHMKAFVAVLMLAAITITFTNNADAAAGWYADARICRSYGFPPHTRAFSSCLLNVRHYWSSGPCVDWNFAAVHKRYCNIIPDADF